MTHETRGELREALESVRDDDTIQAIIITGSGKKAFSAGADIELLSKFQPADALGSAEMAFELCELIETLGKPVIAAVNGYCLGGGCELAMACTFRLASTNAQFGQPEINLGMMTGSGGSQRLPRLVGKGNALEMLLTGKRIDAAEAHRIGLVNAVHPPDELLEAAKRVATEIASKSSIAVRMTLDAVHRGLETGVPEGLRIEAKNYSSLYATEDLREGCAAYFEKRKPRFQGR
jgi:enoyl-CoA hydratase